MDGRNKGMWRFREKLSYYEKVRRSLYELLRDSLERHLMKIALVDSFYNYQRNNVPYEFLTKTELKPRTRKMGKESELFNTFLVIFCEGTIPPEMKNYIRFFPENSVNKKNLEYLANFTLHKKFHLNIRYFDNPHFFDFIEKLLNVDYALLIQQDPTVKKKTRYCLTHFHVKIDWPIADAAEDLARYLRYIQHNLYENGDKEARILQNKLFEYYGCHYSVGGRRTAGLIAAQLLRRLDFISTVYVSSSESRSMYKYSERGVSKFYLVQIFEEQIEEIAQRENMGAERFKNQYLYPAEGFYIAIAEALYEHTVYSKPPKDGKLRRLKPAYTWLRLREEILHPRTNIFEARPINWS
ncbi:MAG: hypothetical protein DRG27_00260 [Deltaproteobacteria bacterium]|nr:MAG: hypothetical protein DRG27_00260 [Deltaproteobacteria bacterium]